MDYHKANVYKKWVESGYKQPETKEELDIIVELQSKGYKPNAELEQSRKKWQQYFEKNRGKIPDEFPKTIFDQETKQGPEAKTKNEIQRLARLLEDY